MSELSKHILGCILSLHQVCILAQRNFPDLGEVAWDREWLSDGLAVHLKNKRFLLSAVFVDEVLRDLVELGRSGARICVACAESPNVTEASAIILLKSARTLQGKLAAAATTAARQEDNAAARFTGAMLYESSVLAGEAVEVRNGRYLSFYIS